MFEKLRAWWTLDAAAERDSPDNPFGPLGSLYLLARAAGVLLGHARAMAVSGPGPR